MADRVINGLLTVLGLALIAMVALSVWNVFSRYVPASAILWADEVLVFAMIMLAWLGAIACAWRNFVIRMDILVNILPTAIQRTLSLIQLCLVAGICLWTAWLSWAYVLRLFRFGMTSDAAGLPLWIVHGAITLSLFVMAMIALLRFVRLAIWGRQQGWQGRLATGEKQ